MSGYIVLANSIYVPNMIKNGREIRTLTCHTSSLKWAKPTINWRSGAFTTPMLLTVELRCQMTVWPTFLILGKSRQKL